MNTEFTVTTGTTERLDRFLADQLAISRTVAARLIAGRAVTIDGAVARASRLLARGETIRIELPEHPAPRSIQPADIPISVTFEDDHLLVLDKPAGLVVHPAPGHWDDTLVNALAGRGTALSSGFAQGRPGIVHRLDRDTSGLLVVAKTDLAHRRLGAALAARKVSRRYAALIWGHLDASPTIIDAPLARLPRDRKRMGVLATGRAARTDAYLVARFSVCDLARFELHTGRTHQIRVHAAHIGHPVVGDPVYGGGGSRRISGAPRLQAERLAAATPRQALHAAYLSFRHPVSGTPLEFSSEWPADLATALSLAAGSTPVAPHLSLRYLGFFEGHG
jgi:23S rRNA pseudouridine1911/1915/1917 synthase